MDCYVDTNTKGHIKHAFEAGTGIISNWDVMEHIFDYIFLKLGMNDVDDPVDFPIVLTEAPANLAYPRKGACDNPKSRCAMADES